MGKPRVSGLGCLAIALAIAVVVVGGFVALLLWSVGNQDDQTALTERYDAVVVGEPKRVGQAPNTSWKFDYAYEAAGRWYGYDTSISRDAWEPDDPLWVCVDPADRTQHVVSTGAECGQEFITAGTIKEASPRSAP